ncbi:MAG TPA: DUF167 domain-containing protein, partial [Acidobacteriota bacterium]|nr:DUF167 domain-containing protein [Acidobacteriota bacterium]
MISVKVIPRSSKTAIIPLSNNTYKIKLTSPPVEDAANRQLIRFLAEKLSIAPSAIEILSGAHSSTKRLKLNGVSETLQAQILG